MSATTHVPAGPAPLPKAGGYRSPVKSVTPANSLRMQRQCSCGGAGGGCESCRKKKPKEMLQRKAVPGA